jgi:hypothetical protein
MMTGWSPAARITARNASYCCSSVGGREEQQLRAVEADALGAELERDARLFGHLDVREQLGGHAIARNGRLVAQGAEARRQTLIFVLLGLVAGEGLGVGVRDDDAVAAVDDERLAAQDVRGDVAEGDDRGDAQHAGDDRHVRGLATDVDREAEHVAPIERDGLRRRDVLGDDDDGIGEPGDVFPRAAENVPQHAALDVEQVAHPFLEVGVGHVAKQPLALVHDLGERIRRRVALLLDGVDDAGAELGIGDELLVKRKDDRGLVAELAGRRGAQLSHFLARSG